MTVSIDPTIWHGAGPRWVLAALVLGLLGLCGCQPSESNCQGDGDCAAGQVCASGGGVMMSGGVCVSRDFDGTDAAAQDAEADGLVDTAPSDISCEPHRSCESTAVSCGTIDDGCGGLLTCGPRECIADVAAGLAHTCAVRRSGELFCWGANASGQLGDGSSTPSSTPVPAVVPDGMSGFVKLAAGNDHTCAIAADGSAWCWGQNQFGQLGTGEGAAGLASADQPTDEVDLSAVDGEVTGLEAMLNTTCMTTDVGGVYCWGAGAAGQVGNGDNQPSNPKPVAVAGLGEAASAVALSICYGCATTANALMCWGDYQEGCGGDGQPNSATQVHQDTLNAAAALAGGGEHTCYTRVDGTLRCFNDNEFGQLGVDPAETPVSATPVDTSGLAATAVELAAGATHTCALDEQGRVFCWGDNRSGQLGSGATTSSHQPVQVGLSAAATALAAGINHTCAALVSGDIECWGSNAGGQLGNGESGDDLQSSEPVGVQF